jgi:hypothetical protein
MTIALPQYGKTGAYSWIKAPRCNGLPHEVGPLARMWAGPVNFSRCCRFGSCAFDSGLMLGVGCVTA